MTHDICGSEELAPGGMLAVTVGSRPILVARAADGRLHAVADRCLHQGARLSGGRLLAAVDGSRPGHYVLDAERQLIKCPWHGYEYDLESGCVLFDARRRLRTYRVAEEHGRIVIEVATPTEVAI